MQVIVIGAGVLGSSLAWRLAQYGADVTLVERGEPAWGTTGTSFSWYNANQKRPRDYFDLNVAGMEAHRQLRDELGEAPWYHEGGNVVWETESEWRTSGDEEGDLETIIPQLRAWDYPAEWLTREEVSDLEPELAFPDTTERFGYFPTEGWIDGPLYVAGMIKLAASVGVKIRYAAEVTVIEMQRDAVTGVRLANGELISGELVVNCAGPGADTVAALAGRTLPLAPTLGFVTRVSGVPPGTINRVLHTPVIHIRPDGNGLIALHHHDADAGIAAGDAPNVWAEELLSRFRQYVPSAIDARVSRWSAVYRPIPADERTSAGLVASIPGYAEIVSHSSITMGAILPQLVADEIVNGERSPLLEHFRPDRF